MTVFTIYPLQFAFIIRTINSIHSGSRTSARPPPQPLPSNPQPTYSFQNQLDNPNVERQHLAITEQHPANKEHHLANKAVTRYDPKVSQSKLEE